MRPVLCAGSVLLVLLSACSSPPSAALAVEAPELAPVHDVSIVWKILAAAPEQVVSPVLVPIRRRARARLPAPGGLRASYYDLPFLITEPVVWDEGEATMVAGALDAPDVIAGQPDIIDPSSAPPVRIDVFDPSVRLATR